MIQHLQKRAIAHVFSAYVGETSLKLRGRIARLRGGGRPKLTYFHCVGDPYSELLSQQIGPLARKYGVDLRVVLVGQPGLAVRPKPEMERAYALKDAQRLAAANSLWFSAEETPPPSVVTQAEAIILAGRSAEDRLLRIEAVRELLWGKDQTGLSRYAETAGALTQGAAVDAIAEGARHLKRSGHYQPAMIFDGAEWYWGPDRLYHLERALGGQETPWSVPQSIETGEIEVFFSFRSPYSYLAIVRLLRCKALHSRLRLRPVLPMVMRGIPVPAVKRLYIVRDTAREARRHNIPFGFGVDPVGVGVERCIAVFKLAQREGVGLEFAESAYRAFFAEGFDVATDLALQRIAQRVGLSWADVLEALQDESWRAEVEENRVALFEMGLWGVPCFRVGALTFWGQDRMRLLHSTI